MKPKLEPPGTKRLKLNCDILLSTSAFQFKLRRYSTAMSDVPGTAALLRQSPAQRSLSRAVYPDEYEASLLDCMAGAIGCEQMLESHRDHLRALRANGPLAALVAALRRHKAATADQERDRAV